MGFDNMCDMSEKLTVERKSVFVLKAINPVGHPEWEEKYDQNLENGDIEAQSVQLGIFDSVEAAEENIKLALKVQDDRLERHPEWGHSRFVCFELIEFYLNEGIDGDGNTPWFKSRRTYDGNGDLHCVSDLDDRCKKRFTGRDEPVRGVNEGDFCWYVGHNSISPILYDKAPLTHDEIKSLFKDGFSGDFTDDSGLAFTVDSGHEHPSPLYVFPLSALPLAELTEEMKNKMLDLREKYYKGEAL